MVVVLSFLGRNLKPVNSTWLGLHYVDVSCVFFYFWYMLHFFVTPFWIVCVIFLSDCFLIPFHFVILTTFPSNVKIGYEICVQYLRKVLQKRNATESTKDWQKNSWKTQRDICICHNLHKDKAQICSFEEHPCCNTRISRQTNATKWCPPPRPHRPSDVHSQDLTDIDFSLIPRPTVI